MVIYKTVVSLSEKYSYFKKVANGITHIVFE